MESAHYGVIVNEESAYGAGLLDPFSGVKDKRALRVCLVTPYDLTYDGGVNSHISPRAVVLGDLSGTLAGANKAAG